MQNYNGAIFAKPRYYICVRKKNNFRARTNKIVVKG